MKKYIYYYRHEVNDIDIDFDISPHANFVFLSLVFFAAKTLL